MYNIAELFQLVDQCHLKQFCGLNWLWSGGTFLCLFFTVRPSYFSPVKGLHASVTNGAKLVAGVGAALYINPVME